MLRYLVPLLLLVLAACGGDEATPAATAPPEIEPTPTREGGDATAPDPEATAPTAPDAPDLPEEAAREALAPGGFSLTVSGAIDADIDAGEADFFPFGSSENRQIRMEISAEDASGETVAVFVSLILREGIEAGNHAIGETLQGPPEIMVRGVAAVGETMYRGDVNGTLVLDAISETEASGRFALSITSDAGDVLSAAGAFNAVPFNAAG